MIPLRFESSASVEDAYRIYVVERISLESAAAIESQNLRWYRSTEDQSFDLACSNSY